MAGLLSIAYPLPTKRWSIAFESKTSKGVILIDADTLAEAKAIARRRHKGAKVSQWIDPYYGEDKN